MSRQAWIEEKRLKGREELPQKSKVTSTKDLPKRAATRWDIPESYNFRIRGRQQPGQDQMSRSGPNQSRIQLADINEYHDRHSPVGVEQPIEIRNRSVLRSLIPKPATRSRERDQHANATSGRCADVF